ncbi:hypothetical protein [Mycolicibacterium chlorophenolicum]|uniref:hypothetical protein n=1 Tax=Mycolicibacterium chlorophenolicum TaxID=37916 RepID=UPI00103C6332|nr:hypothetical protein [Mycolicibacterium chlorophenolicum]
MALAGVGFAAYKIVEPYVWIELQDQVAPTMFAMAGVLGVLAGFAATAVVFVAAANGPGIEQMRLNHGRRLTNALLSTVVTLLVSAVGLVFCGLFANGWGAKGAASALLVAPLYDVLLVFVALRTAINSAGTPKRSAQDPNTL